MDSPREDQEVGNMSFYSNFVSQAKAFQLLLKLQLMKSAGLPRKPKLSSLR
jgi:hypothetical protein